MSIVGVELQSTATYEPFSSVKCTFVLASRLSRMLCVRSEEKNSVNASCSAKKEWLSFVTARSYSNTRTVTARSYSNTRISKFEFSISFVTIPPAELVEVAAEMRILSASPEHHLSFVSMCLETHATMLHLEKKQNICWCVCDYEGTLKQFNDTFHTHAKNNINSLGILSLKFLQKEARASFRPSKTKRHCPSRAPDDAPMAPDGSFSPCHSDHIFLLFLSFLK